SSFQQVNLLNQTWSWFTLYCYVFEGFSRDLFNVLIRLSRLLSSFSRSLVECLLWLCWTCYCQPGIKTCCASLKRSNKLKDSCCESCIWVMAMSLLLCKVRSVLIFLESRSEKLSSGCWFLMNSGYSDKNSSAATICLAICSRRPKSC